MTVKTQQAKDGTWVVSENGCWVEGVYTSSEAAELACTLDPLELHKLWEARCPHPLSVEQLQEMPLGYVSSLLQDIQMRAQAQSRMLEILRELHDPDSCTINECGLCGIICCPHGCDEHFWKDGCPCCYGTPVDPIPEDCR